MKIAIYIYLLILLPLNVCAHGTSHEQISGGVGFQFNYSAADPIAFSPVKIYAPGESKKPYQEGFTDAQGNFVIVPNRAGKWKFVVDDGMGHRAEAIYNHQNHVSEKQADHHHWSNWIKSILGLLIIWGLAGIFYWWRKRK